MKQEFKFNYSKVLLLFAVALLIAESSFSQANFGIYGSYIHNLRRGFKNNTQGVGARFEWAKDDAMLSKYVSLAYCFPMYVA